jgi:hypothetical protein
MQAGAAAEGPVMLEVAVVTEAPEVPAAVVVAQLEQVPLTYQMVLLILAVVVLADVAAHKAVHQLQVLVATVAPE